MLSGLKEILKRFTVEVVIPAIVFGFGLLIVNLGYDYFGHPGALLTLFGVSTGWYQFADWWPDVAGIERGDSA
jgi:hypothetical protein